MSNSHKPDVEVRATLTHEQAEAYAQFLKRVTFHEYASKSVSKDEAYLMVDAGEVLRASLAQSGYAPR